MGISITSEQEQALKKIVEAAGYSGAEQALSEAIRLLSESNAANDDKTGKKMSYESWEKKFEEHLASLPPSTTTFVDDSRESIYEGRGE